MIDQFAEQVMPEVNKVNKIQIETALKVIPSLEHPNYSADKAFAKELVGGQSGLIAAIDGVGSGEEASGEAANIVQYSFLDLTKQILKPLTINQAIGLLKKTIFGATTQIQELQKANNNDNIDTTVSAGIVCESPNKAKCFLLTANVGDSRVYRYNPSKNALDQLTVDHSLVQRLVDVGAISTDEAFNHPQRDVIYRSVGSLKTPDDIGFHVAEIKKGDIFLAVSDGLSDNIIPQKLSSVIISEFQASYDQGQKKQDLSKFVTGLAQRARNIQTESRAKQTKQDDICVAVLRAK